MIDGLFAACVIGAALCAVFAAGAYITDEIIPRLRTPRRARKLRIHK